MFFENTILHSYYIIYFKMAECQVLISEDSESNFDLQQKLKCNYCRKVLSDKKVTCDKCKAYFHKSCMERNHKTCKTINMQDEGNKVEENNKEEFYQTEISLLKRIIRELEEKNSILIENSALLREKVEYLEKARLTSKTYSIPAKTSTINTEVGNSFSLMEEDRTVFNNIPVNETSSQNSKEFVNNSVTEITSANMKNFSEIVQKKSGTHELENKQKSDTEKLIYLNNVNETENVSNDDFKTVTYKRKQKINKHLIHGSGTNITSLTAAPRLGHIHVYGLHPEATDIMVQDHLKQNGITNAT